MTEQIRISNLLAGDTALITGYQKDSSMYRQKILSMGLIRGTKFKLIKKAPMGDPVEIEVLGYKLSLRKDEADIIKVEKISGEPLS